MKQNRSKPAVNKSDLANVQTTFNSIASVYDANRSKLIPCFDDLYSIPVSLVQNQIGNRNKKPMVLDIGAGTGLLTSFLFQKYPGARVTLIDMAEEMLNVARERFKGNRNIKYISADYSGYNFSETFDVIMSAMSIHHLSNPGKRKLFSKIYGLLNPGGIFVNAEQVLGETPELEALYKKRWEALIREEGVPEKQILLWRERLKLDREATPEDQVKWLKKAGFSIAGCPYKFFKFAVMFGVKG